MSPWVQSNNGDVKERFRRYRKYPYEAGAIDKYAGKSKKVIDKKIVEKELITLKFRLPADLSIKPGALQIQVSS